MHYLDNASTTRPCEEAIAAARAAMETHFGNPSSLHDLGRDAEKLMESARDEVCSLINASPTELFFTSGGTEADNWALFSGAEMMRHKGKHIITTAVEHDAILAACKKLETMGYEVTYLSPEKSGKVSVEALTDALRDDTVLVSVMALNNEVGAVMPIAEMAAALKAAKSRALFHTDAVQALCKIKIDVKKLGVDLMSLSAHKVHGIKGAGALYIRKGLKLPPFILGGGQEQGMRSGTQAVPQIAAFGAACKAGRDPQGKTADKMRSLLTMAEERISAKIEGVTLIRGEAPHILTVSMPGCPSQPVLNSLAAQGVYVSAGSACSRGKRSHVLTAMGLDPRVTDCAVRVSLSRFSTEEDITALCEGLEAAYTRFNSKARR